LAARTCQRQAQVAARLTGEEEASGEISNLVRLHVIVLLIVRSSENVLLGILCWKVRGATYSSSVTTVSSPFGLDRSHADDDRHWLGRRSFRRSSRSGTPDST